MRENERMEIIYREIWDLQGRGKVKSGQLTEHLTGIHSFCIKSFMSLAPLLKNLLMRGTQDDEYSSLKNPFFTPWSFKEPWCHIFILG